MRIALDYDGTITRDPTLWELFVLEARASGHEVRVVTSRHPEDAPEFAGCPIFATGMKPKGPFLLSLGWVPDVWIDDHPERIFK